MNAYSKAALPTTRNLEAEQMLLGTILTNNDAWLQVSDFLKPIHFSENVHQRICKVCAEMIEAGRKATPISIKQYFDAEDKVGDLSVSEYLIRLCADVVNLTPIDQAKVIFECWLRNEAIRLGDDIIQSAFNFEPNDKISDLATQAISSLTQLDAQSRYAEGGDTYKAKLSRALDGLQRTVSGEDQRIPWFLPEIQDCAGYMRPGNLIGVMSDSGGGKTSFALQQARYASEKGFKTAFFSIEITSEEAALQAACQKLQIPMEAMDNLELTKEQEDAIGNELCDDLPFRIIEFGQCTTEDISGKAISLKRQHGLDLLIIDHAKLIGLPGRQSDLFSERVNTLYRNLKAMAKELQIAVVILIQRNDSWKKRSGPKPMEGDAYGGGGVKQNLDVWFSIYRPDVFESYFNQQIEECKSAEKKSTLEAKVFAGKGRAWIINHKRRRGAPERSKSILFKAQTVTFKSEETNQPVFGEAF